MTSRKLAVPLSGSGRLTLKADGRQETSLKGVTLAAWETADKGNPTRIVVRCDGNIVKQDAIDGSVGFPCAVLEVEYQIGGYPRKVLVDAVNQSALTLWCTEAYVTPVWDERRIRRLSDSNGLSEQLPCMSQLLAAACSTCCNDTGAADARYLDVLDIDATTSDGGDPPTVFEYSIHPVPCGARAVRFLNTTQDGSPAHVAQDATLIVFTYGPAQQWIDNDVGLLESVNNGMTDTSMILVPVDAQFLVVKFPSGTLAGYDSRTWIEWTLSPSSPVAF